MKSLKVLPRVYLITVMALILGTGLSVQAKENCHTTCDGYGSCDTTCEHEDTFEEQVAKYRVKRQDFVCFSKCTQEGMSYGLCQSKCTY